MMKICLAVVGLCAMVASANAQSAIEHHIWQDRKIFRSFSHTAEMITGSIRLSGNPHFAVKGSTMSISFESGPKVKLISQGASWRSWNLASTDKKTAEVFRLTKDPGRLKNGNTLCGDKSQPPAMYIVFFESTIASMSTLEVAVFNSKRPPRDINSPGLCGTFSFSTD